MSEQAAAPAEGAPEGASQDTGQSPWSFEDAPEELRPYLQTEIKKAEGNITKKFQEAAEYRTRMEPLAPLADVEGLTDLDPQDLAGLVQFNQLVQDPEQFEAWWHSVGEELGFSSAGEPEGEPTTEEPPAWAQQIMQEMEALKGSTSQATAEQREDRALQHIDSELAALRSKHGDFDEDVEDTVLRLAMSYDDEDAVAKGYADYQRMSGRSQAELVDGKESFSGTPVSGGGANMAPDPVNGFGDAKALAKQRFKQS